MLMNDRRYMQGYRNRFPIGEPLTQETLDEATSREADEIGGSGRTRAYVVFNGATMGIFRGWLFAAGNVTGYSHAFHLRFPTLRAAQEAWDEACRAGRIGPRREWGPARARELAQGELHLREVPSPREATRQALTLIRAQQATPQIPPYIETLAQPSRTVNSTTSPTTLQATTPHLVSGGSRGIGCQLSTPSPYYYPSTLPPYSIHANEGRSRSPPTVSEDREHHSSTPSTTSDDGDPSSAPSSLSLMLSPPPPRADDLGWYAVIQGAYPGVYHGRPAALQGMGVRGRCIWEVRESEGMAIAEYLAQSRAGNIIQYLAPSS